MAPTLTVSEIAGLLEEKPDRQAALVERIRHWTREGLIQPIGEKNPGTGRHREYDGSALLDAAVLNLLANLGLQVGQQQNVLKVAREIYSPNKEKLAVWDEKRSFGAEIYIAISSPGGENPKVQELYAERWDMGLEHHTLKFIATSDAFVLINIGRIYEKLGGLQRRRSE